MNFQTKISLLSILITFNIYAQKDSTIKMGVGIGINYTFWNVNKNDLNQHNAAYHGIDLSNSTIALNTTATPSPFIKLYFENGSRKKIKFFTAINLFYSKLLYQQNAETFISSPSGSYKKTSRFNYTISPIHANVELGPHFNIGHFYSRTGLNIDFIYLNERIEGSSIDSGMNEKTTNIKESSFAIAGGAGITIGYNFTIKTVPIYWEFKTAYSLCSYSKANIMNSSTHLGIKF
ncbi:MAG: hypothetical protein JNL24_01785 [Bacteroidia bacterium]|nr:hypothetical protein [Bacteroidia bacterium]